MNAAARFWSWTSALGLALLGVSGSVAQPAPAHALISLGDFADPFVLVDGNTYFAYATNAPGANIQVRRSGDLQSWGPLSDALPQLPSWAKPQPGLVWAPEVMKLRERYLLYFTARDRTSDRQCIGVAVADHAAGPFADSASVPLVCQAAQGGTIDANPFRDGERLYLYFKSDGNCCGQPTHLYAQTLSADGLHVTGEAVPLIRNTQTWEGAVVEAPFMVKRGGRYVLFYSGNDYAGPLYAVGYAECTGPLGPCRISPHNPILKSDLTATPPLIGPGHIAVFRIDDQDWIACHAWESAAGDQRGARRLLYLDQLDWLDGRPIVRGITRRR